MSNDKNELQHMKEGLACADAYIRKLREGVAVQQTIIKTTNDDLQKKQRDLEKARQDELHLRELVSVANAQAKALST